MRVEQRIGVDDVVGAAGVCDGEAGGGPGNRACDGRAVVREEQIGGEVGGVVGPGERAEDVERAGFVTREMKRQRVHIEEIARRAEDRSTDGGIDDELNGVEAFAGGDDGGEAGAEETARVLDVRRERCVGVAHAGSVRCGARRGKGGSKNSDGALKAPSRVIRGFFRGIRGVFSHAFAGQGEPGSLP